ncbi:hypothetical protein HHI36_006246 [Cryptolaemus montrouzieri]|uniref:Uncharacterized protein n=1 Tax=Cryptolaemus montrouzieri TaxID=559131 RepID=A0ABD2NXF5_9CUCU
MDGAPAYGTKAAPQLTRVDSGELTPLDYQLRGRVEETVYETEPANLLDLIQSKQMALQSLDPQEIRRAPKGKFQEELAEPILKTFYSELHIMYS